MRAYAEPREQRPHRRPEAETKRVMSMMSSGSQEAAKTAGGLGCIFHGLEETA
jgi:hypothetical protein